MNVLVIGNRVWIRRLAIVLGRVAIGDDVLTASGTFVNFDVSPRNLW